MAKKAEVTKTTIWRIETGRPAFEGTLQAIRVAFEDAGLEFIDENGGGAGVRFVKPRTERSD